MSIELSTPDKAGSSEETRDWELRLDEVGRQGLARQGLGTFYRSEAVMNALSAPVLDANGEAVLALTAVGEARWPNKTFTALKCRNIRKGRLKCRLSISNGRTLSVTSC